MITDKMSNLLILQCDKSNVKTDIFFHMQLLYGCVTLYVSRIQCYSTLLCNHYGNTNLLHYEPVKFKVCSLYNHRWQCLTYIECSLYHCAQVFLKLLRNDKMEFWPTKNHVFFNFLGPFFKNNFQVFETHRFNNFEINFYLLTTIIPNRFE